MWIGIEDRAQRMRRRNKWVRWRRASSSRLVLQSIGGRHLVFRIIGAQKGRGARRFCVSEDGQEEDESRPALRPVSALVARLTCSHSDHADGGGGSSAVDERTVISSLSASARVSVLRPRAASGFAQVRSCVVVLVVVAGVEPDRRRRLVRANSVRWRQRPIRSVRASVRASH